VAVSPVYNLNISIKFPPNTKEQAVADISNPVQLSKFFWLPPQWKSGISISMQTSTAKMAYIAITGRIHDVVPHKMLSFQEIIIHSSNMVQ